MNRGSHGSKSSAARSLVTWGNRFSLLIVLAFFTSAARLDADGSNLSRILGFYHWGGRYATSVAQGVEQIAALGGKLARLTLSSRYYSDYNLGSGCLPGLSLSDIAKADDVKRALDNEQIEVFMLTSYDATSFGDCLHHLYLNPGFYTTANVAALIKEYSDFTLYLYQTYRNTHKRFILSSWEGDNAVYCGAAQRYATDSVFRAECSRYLSEYSGNQSPEESIRGLTLWFQFVQQGIDDGRRRALDLGIGAKRVYFAPEFSAVHILHDAGFKSVLYDVLPKLAFDYVSYSSYESINQPEPDKALIADLNLIQDIIGSNAIILGEVGFAQSAWGRDRVIARLDSVINAGVSWGVSYIFHWNVYDQSVIDDFGIYDVVGQPTALQEYYKQRIKTRDSNGSLVEPIGRFPCRRPCRQNGCYAGLELPFTEFATGADVDLPACYSCQRGRWTPQPPSETHYLRKTGALPLAHVL